ncbi:hypothetical protein [Virgibacillus oceani]|uniref:Uncharacterized protein n=1 Tax=Virgibacillus oceani TaxID=1479511 RepID=A0A917LYR7_9BACI|nr:hypothetical protein [Virgibacillus oceani]GGG64495.1 hypothetical protein GCM10011398_05110 [Virgibacillus oceani]
MGFSIFIRLWIASVFGKVKISEKYKHLDYIVENNYVLRIENGWTEVNGFPFATYSDWYTITNYGKKAMWGKSELLHTKIISWCAVFISLLALGFSIYTHLTK